MPNVHSRSSGYNLGIANKLYLRSYSRNENWGVLPMVIYTPNQHVFSMQYVLFVCVVYEFCCCHVMCSGNLFYTVKQYLLSCVLLTTFSTFIFSLKPILLPYFEIHSCGVFNYFQYILWLSGCSESNITTPMLPEVLFC